MTNTKITESKSWLKLYRSFLEWEWYDDMNVCRLFIHFLLKANYKDKEWRGITIKRGSFITSLDSLYNELNRNKKTGKLNRTASRMSVQCIRSAIKKLISTHEITKLSTSQYTVITVNNYDRYQVVNKPTNRQLTNEQQTINKRLTTTIERIEGIEYISKDKGVDTPKGKGTTHGNKDIHILKGYLIRNYPKTLEGIGDTRKLWNTVQVLHPRKGKDGWMSSDWEGNLKKFLSVYLSSTEGTYLVGSMDKLREKAKVWREYGGKLDGGKSSPKYVYK